MAHSYGVKVLLTVSGNDNDSSAMGTAISTNLSTLVNNIMSLVTANNYDGVDLDWESSSYSPGSTGYNEYVSFIQALRKALGTGKILSIAVYWHNGLEDVVKATVSQLNQVNVMCYDMDQYLSYTYHNDATTRPSTDSTNQSCDIEAADFAGYVPPGMIGIGIPFYGRDWNGCSNSACTDGLYEPMQSMYRKNQQTILYSDVLTNSSYKSATQIWDTFREATYLSIDQTGAKSDHFVTFASPQQINATANLVHSNGYGGYMEYELTYDYMTSGDPHPLSTAVWQAATGAVSIQPAWTFSVNPASGSGSSQTFTFSITDISGGSVTRADLFIGATAQITNSCWIRYDATTNTLSLASNDNSGWSSGSLGTSHTSLTNSQCTVDLSNAPSGSGSSLNLTLPITFSSTFAGAQGLFASGADTKSSGWQTAGTWTVPGGGGGGGKPKH